MKNNITDTLIVGFVGLFLSTINLNTTLICNSDNISVSNFKLFNNNYDYNSTILTSQCVSNNQIQDNHLASYAKELFGNMRDATEEEKQSVKKYVDSISIDTGVNFFDLC